MLNQMSWLSPFVMQDLKYDGFAFHCFKCAHALVERDNGRIFFFFLLHYYTLTIGTTPIKAILCCYYRDTESFIVWGLPHCLHSEHTECQFSPLSALQSSTCLWGLVLACGLAALVGSPSRTGFIPLLFPAHTCLCDMSMLGYFQEDCWYYEDPDETQWSATSCLTK